MLTKVTAYSQWVATDPLVFNIVDRPETDLFEVRNIDGLEAVKASIGTTPTAAGENETFTGSSVGKRNIVLTIGLDPDWNTWTVSKLRRLLGKTFTPRQSVRLVFESTDFSPVEISGWIESNEPNIFSKDPEHQISIICPDSYFKAVTPVIIYGSSADDPLPITYEGDVETGFVMVITADATDYPAYLSLEILEQYINYFQVGDPGIDATHYLQITTTPGSKAVESYLNDGTVSRSVLNSLVLGSRWPVIGPGTRTLHLVSDGIAVLDWELAYYALFGSL